MWEGLLGAESLKLAGEWRYPLNAWLPSPLLRSFSGSVEGTI